MTRGKRNKQRQRRQSKAQHHNANSKPSPSPVAPFKEQPQIPNPATGNDAVSKENKRKSEKPSNRSMGLQDWFAGCLVLFTLAQAIVGYFQWDATNKQYGAMIAQNKTSVGQLKATEKQLELTVKMFSFDQRPWVVFDTPTIEPLVPSQPIGHSFNGRNIGKMPARLTRGSTHIIFTEPDARQPTVMVPAGYSQAIIAPGDTIDLHTSQAMPVTQDQIEEIKAGKLAVFLIARHYYTDGAGGEFYTARTYILEPKTWTMHVEFNSDQMY